MTIFDHVTGLAPVEAARWTAVVERCHPMLAAEGMEAAQAMLTEHGMSMIQSIAINPSPAAVSERWRRPAVATHRSLASRQPAQIIAPFRSPTGLRGVPADMDDVETTATALQA